MRWHFGWNVLAVLAVVLILPTVWLVVRNSPEDKGVEPEPDSDRSRTLASRHANQLWTTAEILKERAFWVMVVAFTPAATAFSAVQHNLGPYTADLGIAPQQASFLMSVIALSMVGGKTVFGTLADRIDNRFLFWVAAGFNVAGLLILGTEPPYLLLLLSAVFMGIAVGGNMPLTGSIISQHFGPEAFGRVLGLLLPFLTLSSVGPVLAARLRDQAGSYSPAFHLLLGFLVPAVLGMALLPKPESGKTRARSL